MSDGYFWQHGPGLYKKFTIFDRDGKPVDGCFVLRPDRDPAARVALEAYADATDNDHLEFDIRAWLTMLEEEDIGEISGE